jgi:hypothetical protein
LTRGTSDPHDVRWVHTTSPTVESPVRRFSIALGLLLVLLVVGDRVAKARVEGEVEQAVARSFAASSVAADVQGLLVLPQLVNGRLDQVDVRLTDGVVGEPPTRVAELELSLVGVSFDFPPPAQLDRVDVESGQAVLTVHEREVERLVAAQIPGWSVQLEDGSIRATGEVQGAEVRVVAEVVANGHTLRIRAREVDAGTLGPDAAPLVAQAFDTSLDVSGLPDIVAFADARARTDRLLIEAEIATGTLNLE